MMAHYAYLDNNNIVVAVTVGKDETETINGLDVETYYAQGTDYTVKRTSYNARIRKNFAGIGFSYDANLDAFIPPQPFPSWILDTITCQWQAPKPYPQDGQIHAWDETKGDWISVTQS